MIDPLIKWSSEKKTFYTYNHGVLGELKVCVVEKFGDEGKPIGIIECNIKKDDYSLPEVTKEILNKHYDNTAK